MTTILDNLLCDCPDSYEVAWDYCLERGLVLPCQSLLGNQSDRIGYYGRHSGSGSRSRSGYMDDQRSISDHGQSYRCPWSLTTTAWSMIDLRDQDAGSDGMSSVSVKSRRIRRTD